VQDQEPVAVVLDGVLDALAPRRDRHRFDVRRVGGDRQHLAGELAVDVDEDEALRAGQFDADPEALVRLLVHDLVVGGRRAERVPPDPVRAPRVVDREVEQRRTVGRPRRAVERVLDLVGQHLAGGQVLDPQREALVAGEVGGVRETPAVRRDVEGTEREELGVAGQHVAVEQHLLAGQRTAFAERRRVGVVHGGRDAAVDAVLLAFLGTRVVPVRTFAGGYRQVGLLGPGLDLAEQRLAQRREVRGRGLGVRVLGLQVRDRLRVLFVGKPRVLVDDRVAVVGALAGYLLRGRRLLARHERSRYPVRGGLPGPRTPAGRGRRRPPQPSDPAAGPYQ
jgi:hypothetical protein